MSGLDETNWGKIGAIAAIIGVPVAVIAIIVAHSDSQTAQGGTGTTSLTSSVVTPQSSSPLTDTGQPPSTYRTTYPPTTTDDVVPTVQTQGSPTEQPPGPAPNVIDAVNVSVESGNGLILKKGDVYEIQPTYPSSINPPYMTFRWSAQGAGGEVDSGDCNVSATISGPGEYPQHRRDGACSGRVSSDLKVMEPGVYTVSVDVTPPGGGALVSGSTSFTVVPHGG